jgi:hypothetical protein
VAGPAAAAEPPPAAPGEGRPREGRPPADAVYDGNPLYESGPPPARVRRLRRVRQWVQAKLILHGLRASPGAT